MGQDPIVREVREAREAYAAQYNFDLRAIYQALKEQEQKNQSEKVSFPPKRIPPTTPEAKAAATA